jgi:transcriptional regulator with XRE-family HTH domain
MDFGATVRSARKARGYTLEEVAQQAETLANHIWKVERRNSGSVPLLNRLSELLDLHWTGIARGGTLGTRVRKQREKAGLSILETARRAGVSAAAARRVEADRGHIRTLVALVQVIAPNIAPSYVRRRWGAQSGTRDSRFTPPEFLEEVAHVLGGEIDLDPCWHPASAVKAKTTFTEEDDGLRQEWIGRRVFVNPPYSQTSIWVRRAHQAYVGGQSKRILMLIPTQTHTRAFRECVAGVADTFLLNFRLRFFSSRDSKPKLAPFILMVVVFGADQACVSRALTTWDCVHVPSTTRIGSRGSSRR